MQCRPPAPVPAVPGPAARPAWSPDGQQIAFESDRDGNREIYVMNADGTAQRRLTENLAADLAPAWSPDSRFLVFTSERDGDANLFVVEVATGAVARLTSDPGFDDEPAWDDAIEPAATLDYPARLTEIAESAAAVADPFFDEIQSAPNFQAQIAAIQDVWPLIIGNQADALAQIEDLTPPPEFRADHETLVSSLRDLLNTELGLISAAQTGDPNLVGQANAEVDAEIAALRASLSPAYEQLIIAFFE